MGTRTFTDTTATGSVTYKYRIEARNTVGDTVDYGAAGPVANFPTVTTRAYSNIVDGPVALTRYDNTDSRIFYTTGTPNTTWERFPATGTTTGPYQGSYQRTRSNNAWSMIAFNGTQLSVIATKGTTRAPCWCPSMEDRTTQVNLSNGRSSSTSRTSSLPPCCLQESIR